MKSTSTGIFNSRTKSAMNMNEPLKSPTTNNLLV